jgi:coenzyme F420 hydrogenase subunit beta
VSRKSIETISDVVGWRMCLGCGGCAWACPNRAIILHDIPDRGIRPIRNPDLCKHCGLCLAVCPGWTMSRNRELSSAWSPQEKKWGSMMAVWEGYSSDPDIRFRASSGGLATALALYCIEQMQMDGVLHVRGSQDIPWKNETVFSRNRDELKTTAGSRYSPASPCEQFECLTQCVGQGVVIGKPCDIACLRKAQANHESLRDRVGLAISIFCAGTPSTQGTLEVIRRLGASPEQVASLHYRGDGWPGQTRITLKHESTTLSMPYEQSWGTILTGHIDLRCRLCPDGTGEYADLSCGDAWYHLNEKDPGRSLVIVRTQRGKDILAGAIAAGYVCLEPVNPESVALSQKWLERKRQELFGRLLVMKLAGIPTPDYENFDLYSHWKELSIQSKFKSLVGTLRRIVKRQWRKPVELNAPSVPSPLGADSV